MIAQYLRARSNSVTLFQARNSAFQATEVRGLHVVNFTNTQEFAEKLQSELQTHDYDFLIHAAAVADYHVESVQNQNHQDKNLKAVNLNQKIQGSENLIITLKPNPKIIQSVRQWSKNKKMKVISFKLTHQKDALIESTSNAQKKKKKKKIKN